MSGRYSSRYSTGESTPIKAGQPEPSPHLGTAWERQHIYEDLNESSSARLGGSQQLEIPPSLNSKRAASFFQFRWFFTRRGDFNAPQGFYRPPDFCKSAKISQIRLIFVKAPRFLKSAWFSEKRQDFVNPPNFCKSTKISQICLIFVKAQEFRKSAWFFLTANICMYFQYLFSAFLLSMRLFGTWLGMIRITWGKSPEWLYRNPRFSKRATVGVRATYATRWNSGMKRVKCGWTQPLFHKVSNHWFSGRNLKG